MIDYEPYGFLLNPADGYSSNNNHPYWINGAFLLSHQYRLRTVEIIKKPQVMENTIIFMINNW